jgi:hypothetical protein
MGGSLLQAARRGVWRKLLLSNNAKARKFRAFLCAIQLGGRKVLEADFLPAQKLTFKCSINV